MGYKSVELIISTQRACCQLQENLNPFFCWAHPRQGRLILELEAGDFGDGKLQKERAGGLGIGIDNESARVSETSVRHDLGC